MFQKFRSVPAVAVMALVLGAGIVSLKALPVGNAHGVPEDGLTSAIIWYGNLKEGLQVAKDTDRPIFLLSAAPQCAGVPGMW
jgi:hypothetical protein